MAAPRKYPEELRERAIRMALDLRKPLCAKVDAAVTARLTANRHTSRRCASDAHGRHRALSGPKQARQAALTRKRSLVRSQYRPPARPAQQAFLNARDQDE